MRNLSEKLLDDLTNEMEILCRVLRIMSSQKAKHVIASGYLLRNEKGMGGREFIEAASHLDFVSVLSILT
jgi:hypothetical protein